MKECFKCGLVLPRSEFYRHPQMGDGLLGKCKTCTKQDVKAHRQVNAERVRAYDRLRASRPHRRDLRERVSRLWAARFPERKRSHCRVRRAVVAGALIKPDACERCDQRIRVEAHHWDYTRPLLVEWLCKPCHAVADQERRAAEASHVV